MTHDATLIMLDGEELAVEEDTWRTERYLSLGAELVEALAWSRVDYHAVAHLIDQGCPLRTAVEIVR